MNNIFKHIVKNTVGALAIAGVIAVAQTQSASALSLNFSPTGTDLDAQPGPDIATEVGKFVTFNLFLNTNGLQSDRKISNVDYLLDWDATELKKVSFSYLGNVEGGSDGIDFTNPDPANVFKTIGVLQTLATAIGPDTTNWVGSVTFEVLSGLNNSGNPDFMLTYVFPEFSGLSGTQSQMVEVQPKTPVPTPALLPGIFALGATAIRKRKQATAV
jgi:hypothetical protein